MGYSGPGCGEICYKCGDPHCLTPPAAIFGLLSLIDEEAYVGGKGHEPPSWAGLL